MKKTKVISQQITNIPSINIDGNMLTNIDCFKYLGFTTSSNVSLDTELPLCIENAAGVMSKLS